MAKKGEKIELNHDGIGQLLKSEDVQKMLAEISQQHSGGWQTDVVVLGTRAVASIYSTDYDEVGEELENHRIVGGL